MPSMFPLAASRREQVSERIVVPPTIEVLYIGETVMLETLCHEVFAKTTSFVMRSSRMSCTTLPQQKKAKN